MGKETFSKPLPAWSKVIMAFAVCAMLTTGLGILSITLAVKGTFENSQNPAYVARVGKMIALLPEKLPAGYRYFFGVDLGIMRVVGIDFQQGRQEILMVGYKSSKPSGVEALSDRKQAAKTLSRACELGINTTKVQSKFKKVSSQGAWTIQGKSIPYVVGDLEDASGTGLIACHVDQSSGRSMILYSAQPGKEQFDMRVLTDLLQHVGGF